MQNAGLAACVALHPAAAAPKGFAAIHGDHEPSANQRAAGDDRHPTRGPTARPLSAPRPADGRTNAGEVLDKRKAPGSRFVPEKERIPAQVADAGSIPKVVHA